MVSIVISDGVPSLLGGQKYLYVYTQLNLFSVPNSVHILKVHTYTTNSSLTLQDSFRLFPFLYI